MPESTDMAAAARTESASEEPTLSVRDLRVVFDTPDGTVYPVNGVSFDVAPGETLGIVGESGSGKSVSMLGTTGLLPRGGRVVGGSATFGGRDLVRLSDGELRSVRGGEIGMIFQDPMSSLNPVLTVGRQVREALQAHLDLDRRAAERRVAELLDTVGIPSARARMRDYPHQFSGGMRQRVMIAMALACRPRLVIADEPTTALDVTVQAQVLTLLRELVREEGASLILITHDLGVVASMCDRVAVMYGGLVMEQARVEELFDAPRHPYTWSLLRSMPRIDRPAGELLAIPGSPPPLTAPPRACPFQARCSFEVDRSRTEVPPLVEISPDHFVACFNPVPLAEAADA
jgi:oligopeptide/dipeptide ABC transporter ATP-binding protein